MSAHRTSTPAICHGPSVPGLCLTLQVAEDHSWAIMATTPATFALPQLTSPTRLDRRVLLALACVYLIWGSTYLALKYLITGFEPLLGGGSRHLVAGLILFGIAKARGDRSPSWKQWAAATPAGVLLFLIGNGFVTIAEREVSSGIAAIVCGAMPLLIVLFGAATGDRASRKEIIGLLLGFAGVAVMTAHELADASVGASLLLLAPVGWALGSLAARRLAQAPGMMGAAAQMIVGGVATLGAGIAVGESWPTMDSIPAGAIAAWVYLVVAGSIVAFTAYSFLLRNTRPALATSYAYVNPVIAVLLGVTLAGEKLTLATLAGGALIVAGVAVVVRAKGTR